MSEPRTEAEKQRIFHRCLEIERQGGDIIAYLKSENYISPRATWHNFQRCYTKRKPEEFTSGRPTNKGETDMEKTERPGRIQILAEIIEEMKKGVHPYDALKQYGYANVAQAYTDIRQYARDKAPDLYEAIPEEYKIMSKRYRPKNKLEKQEQLQLEAGKDYSLSVAETPITKPLCYGGKTAIGWKGDFGRYIYDDRSGYFDYESNDGEEISMPVDAWKAWMNEIRDIWQLMGVEL
jgi:hypothetical protein